MKNIYFRVNIKKEKSSILLHFPVYLTTRIEALLRRYSRECRFYGYAAVYCLQSDTSDDRSTRLPTLFIDTPIALDAFCTQVSDAPWLAIDTEFMREKTYYPQFCLIQIATPDIAACIDPIKLTDLTPLYQLIYNTAIVKVLHACRQDLEIFYHLRNEIPTPLFDTQIAAPLIGMNEQIGYAGLISDILGIQLHKGHSRTDWSQRPLTEEQLLYAAEDVIYLAQAYPVIRERLETTNRLSWLESECAALSQKETYDVAPAFAWKRIASASQLRNKALPVLKALAAWREKTARDENLPRGWIIKDDALLDLARQQPLRQDKLRQVRGMDERSLKRYGATLCSIIAQALEQPADKDGGGEKPAHRNANLEALLDTSGAIIRLIAEQNKLNPGLLASRRDLELFLAGNEESRLLHGWRRQMAAETLQAYLDGKTYLSVCQSTVTLIPHNDA
jgi:ribonuclease D